MRLNQATDYAFRMVLHMAVLPEGSKITGGVLAREQVIPERFLLKIMRSLIAAGIMKSYRGVDGGFSLNKKPEDITLFDVIVACCGHCSVYEVMAQIQHNLTKDLKAVTFDKLAAREVEIAGEASVCNCQ